MTLPPPECVLLPSRLRLRWLEILGDLVKPMDSNEALSAGALESLCTSEDRRRPAVKTLVKRFRGGDGGGAGEESTGRLEVDVAAIANDEARLVELH